MRPAVNRIGVLVAAPAALALSVSAAVSLGDPLLGDDAAGLYKKMSDADVELAVGAMQHSLTNNLSGRNTPWENPESGNSGSIVAGAVFVTNQGVFCRDYKENVVVGEDLGIVTNTACRDPRGVWRLIE